MILKSVSRNPLSFSIKLSPFLIEKDYFQDHPVLDSRYLLFEAQQAHHFGLPVRYPLPFFPFSTPSLTLSQFQENLALAAITTNSARVAGFGHRLGRVAPSYDADVVLWDSHPLSLGATPLQVLIDGIPQLDRPFSAKRLSTEKEAPAMASMPDDPLTLQKSETDAQGLPERRLLEEVVFTNVREVLLIKNRTLLDWGEGQGGASFEVHVRRGEIVCFGKECALDSTILTMDLRGGSLLPPIVSFGSALGLLDIIAEPSTSDNAVFDPLSNSKLNQVQVGQEAVAVRAVDGISFGGKHLRVAMGCGVTKSVTAPIGEGFGSGVSVAFRTDAKNG